MAKQKSYEYCVVLFCKSSTAALHLPTEAISVYANESRNKRKVAKGYMKEIYSISPKASHYCYGDYFNVIVLPVVSHWTQNNKKRLK